MVTDSAGNAGNKDWSAIEGPQDIRLVVADMDGTLLDGHSEIPASFWPMLEKLEARGIPFVPASGRQFATLERMFGDRSEHMSFIAENGNVVSYAGDIVSVRGIDRDVVRRVIDAVDEAVASGKHDIGLIVCGLASAYASRTDEPFVKEASKYYARLAEVDDLHAVLDDEGETILKLAVFDFDAAEPMAEELFSDLKDDYAVVVSGAHWVDIMDKSSDKKLGVEALQKTLHVTPAQTAVFGDYLNDAGMLEAADWSFAMANGHDDVKAVANYIAPANTEGGVMTVVDRLIG